MQNNKGYQAVGEQKRQAGSGGNEEHQPKRARLTRKNLALFDKMGKRKRNALPGDAELPLPAGEAKKLKVIHQERATPVTIQIIIGTYEKVLHGITASIKSQAKGNPEEHSVEFADTFLLNAHTSAIRCLAVRMFAEVSPFRYPFLVRKTSFETRGLNVILHVSRSSDSDPQRMLTRRSI